MTTEAVFIQVGALADGFKPESYTLSQYDKLSGQIIEFYFAKGNKICCQFEQEQMVSWHHQPAVAYRSTSLRPGIVFIDFVNPQRANQTITLVCDLNQGLFSAVFGTLPDEEAVRFSAFSRVESGLPLTAVETEIHFGTLDRPYESGQLHHFTDELLGLRNMYTYSLSECYEHIYLNENFYVWQCLEGVEKGLADVDRCHYIKLAERLYLFVWQEKIIPTLGVIMIDLDVMRTDGKIVGYQNNDFQAISNFAVGAYVAILNQTTYPNKKT